MLNYINTNFNFDIGNHCCKIEDIIDKINIFMENKHQVIKFSILPAEKFTRPNQQASLGESD